MAPGPSAEIIHGPEYRSPHSFKKFVLDFIYMASHLYRLFPVFYFCYGIKSSYYESERPNPLYSDISLF